MTVTYAGPGPRFGAPLIDAVVFCVALFPITRIVKGVWLMSATDHRWVGGLFVFDPLCLVFLIVMFSCFSSMKAYGAGLSASCVLASVSRIPREDHPACGAAWFVRSFG